MILVFILLVSGLLTAGLTAWLMARMILCPARMTDGKAVYVLGRLSPEDLGMAFEEVRYTVRDFRSGGTIPIAGWWIPAPAGSSKSVVLIHGYADAKVGALAWVPMLHEAGVNVLAIDLRAHGESGGQYFTAGFFEREDVNQVLDRLRSDRPGQTGKVFLMGFSIGAQVAVAVSVRRTDLSGVILDSPIADFQSGLSAHARLLRLPGGIIQASAVRLAEWLSCAKFSQVRTIDLIRNVQGHLLVMTGDRDELLNVNERQLMRSATEAVGGEYWEVTDTTHLMPMVNHPAEYQAKLKRFLADSPPNG